MTLTSDIDEVAPWIASRTECDIPEKCAVIGWKNSNDVLCAGVLYDHYTGTSITATIAIEQGVIVSQEFIKTIFDYPFNQLNVDKILAYSEDNNAKSRTILIKFGFVEEARISNVYPSGAMVIYTMDKETCRWLGNRNNTPSSSNLEEM